MTNFMLINLTREMKWDHSLENTTKLTWKAIEILISF